jgi:hypothetical protein
MRMTFSGGCLCGAVRYQCHGEPFLAVHCYCTDCRRTSGGGHGSHLGVPRATVVFTGQLRSYVCAADSGNLITRAFCGDCGAQIYSDNAARPDFRFLRASSLDDPELFKPNFAVYAIRRASWDAFDPALPHFEFMSPPAPTEVV